MKGAKNYKLNVPEAQYYQDVHKAVWDMINDTHSLAQPLLDIDKKQPFIVIDVGGGSTEVSVFEHGERVAARSFQIGTLRLLKNKVVEGMWQDIHQWIASHVDLKSPHKIFGTGGNINKVHKLIGAGHLDGISLKKITHLITKPMSFLQKATYDVSFITLFCLNNFLIKQLQCLGSGS